MTFHVRLVSLPSQTSVLVEALKVFGRARAQEHEQRIALARAFLRDSPLLLLDEPAAHLDPAGARLIGTAIDTALPDRTVVLVSHRRGWAGGRCRVISLDQGKLTSPPRDAWAASRNATAVLP
jgi:ABC-type transport system involved in cytochrome bd biosynthesis fused ATPase/permease subunit